MVQLSLSNTMLKLCTHYPRGQISPQPDYQHFGIWYTTILLLISEQHVFVKNIRTIQNYSLELMFVKFATAKNRVKLNPPTVSCSGAWKQRWRSENSALWLGFEPGTSRFQASQSQLIPSQKHTRVNRKTLSPWISRADRTIAKFYAL